MCIHIDPIIGEHGLWAAGVQRANSILELVMGQELSKEVTAQWSMAAGEQKRIELRLRLTDYCGAVEKSFAPEELADAKQVWFHLNHLWGDLLQARSRKQLEELQKSLQTLGEG